MWRWVVIPFVLTLLVMGALVWVESGVPSLLP